MQRHTYKGWIIRRVMYPVLSHIVPGLYSETDIPDRWPEVNTVTQVEMVWGYPYRWPTVDEMHDGVYECNRIFATDPDVIVAGFPSRFQGVDIR